MFLFFCSVLFAAFWSAVDLHVFRLLPSFGFANFLSRGSNHLILNWKTAKSVRVSQMFVYCDDCSTVLVLCTNTVSINLDQFTKCFFIAKLSAFCFSRFELFLRQFKNFLMINRLQYLLLIFHDFGRHSVADKFNL